MRVYEFEDSNNIATVADNGEEIARFVVVYARCSTRKNKKWENDGVLVCHEKVALLWDEHETEVITRSTTVKRLEQLEDGKILVMGRFEVQIQERIDTVKKCKSPLLKHRSTVSALPHYPGVLPSGNQGNVSFDEPKMVRKREAESFSEMPSVKRIASATSRKSFVSPFSSMSDGREKAAPVEPLILNEFEVRMGATPLLADSSFTRHLREHQRQGVQFLFDRLKDEGNGAILADEMGLGKTIQTITATWALLTSKIIRKCLVVVPSSLVNNWKAEFKKWFLFKRFPVMDMQHGKRDIHSYMAACHTTPYFLTSYDLALRNATALGSVGFDLIVCDEGHRLKNMAGRLRQALDGMAIRRRLILTGTPLQNDHHEFFSLLDFVRPGHFGTAVQFIDQCKDDQDSTITNLINDCMLRRLSDVNAKRLPKKFEYVLFCRPSELQKRVYQAICDCMRGEALVLIDMLRKLSNHPSMLWQSLLSKGVDNAYFPLTVAFPADYGNRANRLEDCGKLSVLVELLGNFRCAGECCVVVSGSTKTLTMIGTLCEYLELCVFRLDGKTAVAERQKLVNRFNEEKNPQNVFLLSTKAGGVGLNLIGASRLILYDSDWNPAADLQATARIWRDGQTRPCHIYRLATAGMIDEKILQRQIKKTGLSSVLDVLAQQESNKKGQVKFTDEDLCDIFSVKETDCQTHELCECDCGGSGLLPNERDVEEEGEDEEEDEDVLPEENETAEVANVVDEEEEENEQDQSENAQTSLAELFRWRHFSPNTARTWHLFCVNSAVPENCAEISFAFQHSAQF